jgi:serine/threonine protein kinase
MVPAVSGDDPEVTRKFDSPEHETPGDDKSTAKMLGVSTWPKRAGSMLGGRTLAGEIMKIDRYEIRGQLGSGGSSIVFEAYDPHMDRVVALKLVDVSVIPGSDANDPVLRSVREAQALAQISHPNVVRVYEVAREEDTVRIVMERVEGQTMRHWMKAEENRPWREVLRIFVQAARGLAAAHAGDLVHRDFKPDNVLVSRTGDVRVLDFGLARAPVVPESSEQGDAASSTTALKIDVTQSGTILGTPAYMAPEQFSGDPATAASDQFSFCLVLYEALYGQRAFEGERFDDIRAAVTGTDPRPPPEDRDVPEFIWPVLKTGMSRRPEDRWESIEQLLGELKKYPGDGEMPSWWTW